MIERGDDWTDWTKLTNVSGSFPQVERIRKVYDLAYKLTEMSQSKKLLATYEDMLYRIQAIIEVSMQCSLNLDHWSRVRHTAGPFTDSSKQVFIAMYLCWSVFDHCIRGIRTYTVCGINTTQFMQTRVTKRHRKLIDKANYLGAMFLDTPEFYQHMAPEMWLDFSQKGILPLTKKSFRLIMLLFC